MQSHKQEGHTMALTEEEKKQLEALKKKEGETDEDAKHAKRVQWIDSQIEREEKAAKEAEEKKKKEAEEKAKKKNRFL
jgi:hypothetical protein